MTLIEVLNSFTVKFLAQISLKFAKKTDIPKSLPANGGDAATVNKHTVNEDVPSGAVFTDTKDWNSFTGKPTEFPSAPHTHGNADITALDATKLTGKIKAANLPDDIKASSVAWGNVSEKPNTFVPSPHTHTSTDISDFEECTDADIDAIISGAFEE